METPTTKVCSGCGIEKPISSFGADRGAPSGIKRHCKECGKIQRDELNKRKAANRKPVEIPPTKVCAKCGMEKESKDFARRTASKDGLEPWCRACKSAHSKPYNAKRNAKPEIREERARFYQENRDMINARNAEWKASYPDEVRRLTREGIRRTKARRLGLEVVFYTEDEVFELYGFTCQLCLEEIDMTLKFPDPMSFTLDHIIPQFLPFNGPDKLENVWPAHKICNERRAKDGSDIPELLKRVRTSKPS